MKRALGAVLAAAGSLLPLAAWADGAPGGNGSHGHMWGTGWGWGHMLFGPLMMIVVIAAIVVAVVLVVRWVGGSDQGRNAAARPPATRSSLDILEERYARGEIDTAEFEERRRTLGQ